MQTLREAREERGIKQKVIAEALYISRQTYAKYEKNAGSMPVSMAKKACAFIGVDFEQITFDAS